MAKYILELDPETVRFEPVSKLTNVFFDEANCQVFAVRSGGTTGVVVKGPTNEESISFRMHDKGDVMSIKFSPDKRVLSVQRSYKSIEFINFNGEPDTLEYSQSCKGKTTKIIGFSWTHSNEIVFVTDHGIEHYQVLPEKRSLKSLKVYNLSVNWYVYHPENSLLLLSSGSLSNVMHPFQFRPGAAYRLPKFEIDLPAAPKMQNACLLERDVSVATVYSKTCIFVLRHQPRSAGNPGAEIVVYTVIKDGPPKKTDILKLDKSGRFAINIIDNVIVVHHQASQESMLYDIKLPSETDGYVTYHSPVVMRCPIKPFVLKIMPLIPTHNAFVANEINCELYSPNWVVFQPNIIIDPKLGCLWYVMMSCEPLPNILSDKCLLIDFLLLRKNAKPFVLKVCQDAMSKDNQLPLQIMSKIFDKLNAVLKQYSDLQKLEGVKSSSISKNAFKTATVIDQSDMYTHVFSTFDNPGANPKFFISVLLEYIRSLTIHQQFIQHYLCKLMIDVLVQNKQFYKLHQFMQYHILSDSKQLACLMLALQDVYPPAYQLALDMLKRLHNSNEEIVDILMSQNRILQALSFIRSCNAVDSLSAQKYLSAAKQTGDPAVFYSVFKFFEQRNIKLRGGPEFESGEHCDSFVKYFDTLFGTSSLDSSLNW